MIYTSTMTKTGQVFFPKAVRVALGLEPGTRITLHLKNNSVAIERAQTVEEIAKKFQATFSKETKEIIAKNRGKTAGEMREEWLKSEESTKYYGEKYGIKVR